MNSRPRRSSRSLRPTISANDKRLRSSSRKSGGKGIGGAGPEGVGARHSSRFGAAADGVKIGEAGEKEEEAEDSTQKRRDRDIEMGWRWAPVIPSRDAGTGGRPCGAVAPRRVLICFFASLW